MKWFSRVLLLILCLMCLAQALYVVAWKLLGPAFVEGFLSYYYLPTHTNYDPWQAAIIVALWFLLSWSCLYAVMSDIRFHNIIRCKPLKGGDTILLTDSAINKVLLNTVRRIPSVAKAGSHVTNVVGGGIVVTYFIWWYQGESIVDGGDEVRRRTQAVFDRILGVQNLKKVKIITKGLKFREESKKKIAKAVAAPTLAGKKG